MFTTSNGTPRGFLPVRLQFSLQQILDFAESPFCFLSFSFSISVDFLLNSWDAHNHLLTKPSCLNFYPSCGSAESHTVPSCLSNFLGSWSQGYTAGLHWSEGHGSLEHSWTHTRLRIVEGVAQNRLHATVQIQSLKPVRSLAYFLEVSEFHLWNRAVYCQTFVLTLDQRTLNRNRHGRSKTKHLNISATVSTQHTFLILNDDTFWEILTSNHVFKYPKYILISECFLFSCTFKNLCFFHVFYCS